MNRERLCASCVWLYPLVMEFATISGVELAYRTALTEGDPPLFAAAFWAQSKGGLPQRGAPQAPAVEAKTDPRPLPQRRPTWANRNENSPICPIVSAAAMGTMLR